MTRFIGDVHGKYQSYRRLIGRGSPPSIQVGDMGVGFRHSGDIKHGELYPNPPHYAMVSGNHRFIRGNHDSPADCRRHSQCIPDGTVEGDTMFVGGAMSIDREFRTEGYSWWPDEELSDDELRETVSKFIVTKPHTMVTHDCPGSVAEAILQHLRGGRLGRMSRTQEAFQHMWSAHSPRLWVFGHWHVSFDFVLGGTRFVCLNELEARDL